MSNWTKEQLKDLARVPGSRKNKIPTEETESAEESQRKVHKRAIPKTLFSAILIAPALVIVYLFMGNNLNFDQNHQELKAAEPEPKTKQLQVQLKAANDKIEELEAKMAVVKQEQSRSVPEVQKVASGLHGKIMNLMLYRLNKVIGVSHEITQKLKEYYPRHSDKFMTILNGHDHTA